MAVATLPALVAASAPGSAVPDGSTALATPGTDSVDPFALLFAVPVATNATPALQAANLGEAVPDPLIEQLIVTLMTPPPPDPRLAQWTQMEPQRPASDLLWPPALAGLPNLPITGDAAAMLTADGNELLTSAPTGDPAWSRWRDLVNALTGAPQAAQAVPTTDAPTQPMTQAFPTAALAEPMAQALPTAALAEPMTQALPVLTEPMTQAFLTPADVVEPMTQVISSATRTEPMTQVIPTAATVVGSMAQKVPAVAGIEPMTQAADSASAPPNDVVTTAVATQASVGQPAPLAATVTARKSATVRSDVTDHANTILAQDAPSAMASLPLERVGPLPVEPAARHAFVRSPAPNAPLDAPAAASRVTPDLIVTGPQSAAESLNAGPVTSAERPLGSVATAPAPQPAAQQQPANPLERMVVHQVARSLMRMTPDGDRQMVLRLTPAELGTVRITLHEHQGVITAHLHAEDAAVRQAIERLLPSLRGELRGNDSAIGDVQVDRTSRAVSEATSSRNPQPDGDGRQPSGQGDQGQASRDQRQDRRQPDAPRFSLDPDDQPVPAAPLPQPVSVPRPRSSSALDALA